MKQMAAALEMNFSARMSMKELDDLAKAIRALLARFEAPHPAAKAPEVIACTRITCIHVSYTYVDGASRSYIYRYLRCGADGGLSYCVYAVSYTHLTLPTKLEV